MTNEEIAALLGTAALASAQTTIEGVRAFLVEARRRIGEIGWTQGTDARDALGNALDHVNGPDVCAYCALGALAAADVAENGAPFRFSDTNMVASAVLARVVGLESWCEVPCWNDAKERTRDEVLAAFDRAIAKVDAFVASRAAAEAATTTGAPCPSL